MPQAGPFVATTPPPCFAWSPSPFRGGILALLLASAPLAAQTVAITGGTVAIGDGTAPIVNGTVLIRDGRVVAAGAGVAVPAGVQTIDARGKWVAAGIVAGFSDLGLSDAGGIEESNDTRAKSSPFAAAIDVSTAINPLSAAIGDERAGGVTRAFVAPAIAKVPGATGLDWGHAFAAITSGPAKALGMDGEIGSLRPGRRGDVVVWDGDPLELSSAPVAVFIDGKPQSIASRQRALRDRYLTPGEGALPKAYER